MKSELYCISSQIAFDIDDTKEKFVCSLGDCCYSRALLNHRRRRPGHTRTPRSRMTWDLCQPRKPRRWTPILCRTACSCNLNGSFRESLLQKSRFVIAALHLIKRYHFTLLLQQAPAMEESKSFKRDNTNVSPANTDTYLYSQLLNSLSIPS